MESFMCSSSDDKLQMFESNMDTGEKITSVLPDFLIPESIDPIFICSTCLEQISFFYTIKKASLQNCSRLKYFDAMLKGTDNFKSNELQVIINSDEVSAQRKHHIQFKVNPKSKYLLSLDEQDATSIKEEDKEYDDYSQQLVNDESSSDYLQEDEPSSSSDDSAIKHKNSKVSKFTKKDFDLKSNNSRHKDQPNTQRESRKKRFKCAECHKAFTRSSELQQHTRVHTGERPHKCATCQKTFTQRSHLNTHKLIHTGEKPHECDKTFTQSGILTRHKLTHSGQRPHQCHLCQYKCTRAGDLKKHMRHHTGEKPYSCKHCEKSFTSTSNLNTHIRSHTGEKPHSCKHCEKSFTTTSNLKLHKRRHHSNEDSD